MYSSIHMHIYICVYNRPQWINKLRLQQNGVIGHYVYNPYKRHQISMNWIYIWVMQIWPVSRQTSTLLFIKISATFLRSGPVSVFDKVSYCKISSWNREILSLNYRITLKFDRRLGSTAAEEAVKCRRLDNSKHKSCGFETSQDLTIKTYYCILKRAPGPSRCRLPAPDLNSLRPSDAYMRQ